MTVVRIRHIQQARVAHGGFCAPGVRAWFERHKFNFPDFVRNGIDAEKLLALNDHFGNQVVAKAKEEEQQGANYG